MFSPKTISIVFRVVFVFLTISNYFVFVVLTWIPIAINHTFTALMVLIVFHFLFIMSTWTTLVTCFSDPGQVPIYWGFYIGDPDSMRSRYCLMCNVFKPVRCHHCSVCNRCVLNMDHHCPWINNCIGFYNRKYFIMMVFYLNCTLIYVLVCNVSVVINIVLFYIKDVNWSVTCVSTWLDVLNVVVFGMDVAMEVILIQFFKFHVKLILENKTTIETLDHKGKEFKSKFDKGKWDNYYEVMGMSKVLWFFPLKRYYGKPKGNGIEWGELIEEENEMKEGSNSNNYNKHPTTTAEPTGKTRGDDDNIPSVNTYNAPQMGGNGNDNDDSDNNQNGVQSGRDNSQISMITKHHPAHSSMGSLYDNNNNNNIHN